MWTTGPKYYNEEKTWHEAKISCATKGGNLAVLPSAHRWQRLQSYIALMDNKTLISAKSQLWIGGTDNETEGEWKWIDGSLWKAEEVHWHSYSNRGKGGDGADCLRLDEGKFWDDVSCTEKFRFVCDLPAKIKIQSVMKLDFITDQKNWNMIKALNLVRECRLKGIGHGYIWQTVLKNRWEKALFKKDPCLDVAEVAEVIDKSKRDLNLVFNTHTWIIEEDLVFGTELYSALQNCPDHLMEAKQLSVFFENLLTNHNLTTVAAATVHNIQPNAGNNIKDLTAVNMWFDRLGERFNFSLGNLILPLSDTEQLKQLAALEPPYLKNFRNVIDLCLGPQDCNNLPHLFGKKKRFHKNLRFHSQMSPFPWK